MTQEIVDFLDGFTWNDPYAICSVLIWPLRVEVSPSVSSPATRRHRTFRASQKSIHMWLVSEEQKACNFRYIMYKLLLQKLFNKLPLRFTIRPQSIKPSKFLVIISNCLIQLSFYCTDKDVLTVDTHIHTCPYFILFLGMCVRIKSITSWPYLCKNDSWWQEKEQDQWKETWATC